VGPFVDPPWLVSILPFQRHGHLTNQPNYDIVALQYVNELTLVNAKYFVSKTMKNTKYYQEKVLQQKYTPKLGKIRILRFEIQILSKNKK